MAKRTLPTQEEIIHYAETLSNWGRWGPQDQLGTVNLITGAKRTQATALVKDGVTVSCSWPISTCMPGEPMSKVIHYMTATGERFRIGDEETDQWSGDFLGMEYHGMTITHVDALCHAFWRGQTYNGHPSQLVNAEHGAQVEAIDLLGEGVVSRGVLLDVARHREVSWMEPGEPVFPEELEEVEEAEGVRVGPGDILLFRTGHLGRHYLDRPLDLAGPHPGMHAVCLPWIRERDIAMLGSDLNSDLSPSGYDGLREPIHQVGIPTLGLWLLDNANLEGLSQACAQRHRWEFLLVIAPLKFKHATGCPVNPVAIF